MASQTPVECQQISASELAEKLKDRTTVAVVDLRDEDFQVSRIKGSLHFASTTLKNQEIKQKMDQEVESKPTVVFYCSLGQIRSPVAAKEYLARLKQKNVETSKDVRWLNGGFVAWKAAYAGDTTLTERITLDIQ